MKKALAIFFMLQFISNQSFALELVRLPVLFIHYLEHQSQKNHHHHDDHEHGHGFVDFVKDHYGEEDEDDNDSDHHHLPFKHCSDCYSVNGTGFMLCENAECIQLIPLEESGRMGFIFAQSFKSQFHKQIWQPPKLR